MGDSVNYFTMPGMRHKNPRTGIRQRAMDLTLQHYGQPLYLVRSRSRNRLYVEPRQLYGYLAYMFGYSRDNIDRGKHFSSLQSIGEYIKRDHATVLNGIRRVISISATDEGFNKKRLNFIEELEACGYIINKNRMRRHKVVPIYDKH